MFKMASVKFMNKTLLEEYPCYVADVIVSRDIRYII